MGLPARHHQVSRRAAVALLMLGVMLTASTPQAAGRSTAPSRTLAPDLASGPPYWLPVTPMHTPRSDLAATLGPDGRIYDNVGGGTLATAKAYNPVTNAWSVIAPMTMPRAGLGPVTGPDGRLYAIGGNDGKHDATSVEAYLPATRRWVIASPTGSPPAGLAAVAGPHGTFYVAEWTRGINVYAPLSHSWTHKADLLIRRPGFAVALGPDQRLYIVGGGSDDGIYTLPIAEAYDTRSGRRAILPSMPTDRSDLAAVSALTGASTRWAVVREKAACSMSWRPMIQQRATGAPLRT